MLYSHTDFFLALLQLNI